MTFTGGASPTSGGQSNKSTGYYKEKIPSGYSKAKLQNFTPEAMDLYKSMFSHVGPDSYLSKLAGGDEEAFNELEAPALKQFSGLQGGLASRFSSGGGGGGGQAALSSRNSSGFQNTMNQAGSDFAQQLQSQRMGLRNQAMQDLFNMSHQLMNEQPYENKLVKKEDKGLGGWGGVGGAAIGAGAGFFMGNPLGGAKLGYTVGSGFD